MDRTVGPRRVVLIGPESTGKTWLARELCSKYGAPCSSEFAREYVEAGTGSLSFADVNAIGKGQKAAEDAVLAQAVALSRPFVILDTDLVSTLVYSRHYYGRCPEWIEREAPERLGDLYLLHHVDLEWTVDGEQRQQPERRAELFDRFQSTLQEFGARVTDVEGSWDVRRRVAIERIDHFLAQGS